MGGGAHVVRSRAVASKASSSPGLTPSPPPPPPHAPHAGPHQTRPLPPPSPLWSSPGRGRLGPPPFLPDCTPPSRSLPHYLSPSPPSPVYTPTPQPSFRPPFTPPSHSPCRPSWMRPTRPVPAARAASTRRFPPTATGGSSTRIGRTIWQTPWMGTECERGGRARVHAPACFNHPTHVHTSLPPGTHAHTAPLAPRTAASAHHTTHAPATQPSLPALFSGEGRCAPTPPQIDQAPVSGSIPLTPLPTRTRTLTPALPLPPNRFLQPAPRSRDPLLPDTPPSLLPPPAP